MQAFDELAGIDWEWQSLNGVLTKACHHAAEIVSGSRSPCPNTNARFVGAYAEPPAPSISLPFTLANFRALLAEGARPDARYTHQQIKAWADQFWWRYTEWPADPAASVPADLKAAARLAQDIEMQWDMYLANTHTLQQLQHLDVAQVRLPEHWFAEWLARLNQLAPPTVSE